jgi:hypothetical protein
LGRARMGSLKLEIGLEITLIQRGMGVQSKGGGAN